MNKFKTPKLPKLPKLTKVLKIIQAVAIFCNTIIMCVSAALFANRGQYSPIQTQSKQPQIISTAKDAKCDSGSYKFQSLQDADDAAQTLNSFSIVILFPCMIFIFCQIALIIIRLLMEPSSKRYRGYIILQLLIKITGMPLYFMVLSFNFNDCLKSDLWYFAINNISIIFYAGIIISVISWVLVIMAASMKKVGECSLQILILMCILNGFFFVVGFYGTVRGIFFTVFQLIGLVLGFFALAMIVKQVKELTGGQYESQI